MRTVREQGFGAVAKFTEQFDLVGLAFESVQVPQSKIDGSLSALSSGERVAMLEMKERISSFCRAQASALQSIRMASNDGWVSLVFEPLSRAGIYVPAGRAPLFSSLFMAALPAQAAGVREIIVCTPPQQDGEADARILAAAKMCGISKVFKIGGAQAIASMAFGLQGLLPSCGIICGPGNSFVNAAKMQCAAEGIRIDVPAGPSEVLIIADETADAAFAAADMLAQAEHGGGSAAICISASEAKAREVEFELARQLMQLPSFNPAHLSIPRWGRIWVARDIQEAIGAANEIACEHVELLCRDAEKRAAEIRNAGAVFIGTAEAFCDYGMSGGNHILPTGSSAKSWGGVSVQTFGRWRYVDSLTRASQRNLAQKTALLARMEGLEAHARAAEQRVKEKDG